MTIQLPARRRHGDAGRPDSLLPSHSAHDGQIRIDHVADYDGQFRRGCVWVEAPVHPLGRAWQHLAVIGVVVTAAGRRKRNTSRNIYPQVVNASLSVPA